MANIKSAKKRILVNAKRAERNKAIRSGVKTAVKKVDAAIAAGDKAAAVAALDALKSEMGRATSKGVFKKNTNARKISRMAKKVDAIG
ncbi:MAG TPA: 30S ribosomal protein S20 [Lachnospiraceae bacterium]|nr:30S ribosomal protein S20 [Lachnospiraceae bacterium]